MATPESELIPVTLLTGFSSGRSQARLTCKQISLH
jgi:hypothetical protein